MKSALLFTIFIVGILKLSAQELVFEKDIHLKSFFSDKRESIPIVNKVKEETALFLIDKKMINVWLLDKNFKFKDSFSVARADVWYSIPLGYSVDSNSYHLYFTSKDKKEFSIQSMDITGKKTSRKRLFLNLKKESYLESISYQNKFYYLTVKKNSSILKIYIFEGGENPRIEEVDLSSYIFRESTKSPQLYSALNACHYLYSDNMTIELQKVDNENSNPLELTSALSKIYYFKDKFYITLDNQSKKTQIITIDLIDFKSSVKDYPHGNTNPDDDRIKSNSYLNKSILYQINATSSSIYFSAYDITKNALLKEFTFEANEYFPYKNTPIIQEGGWSKLRQDNEMEIEKTKKAFRKITGSNQLGVSAYPSKGNMEITMGGYEAFVGGGSTVGGPIPSGVGGFPGTYHYNPTMYGYGKSTNTRTVYFKTLLENKSFEHVEGNVTANAFDKIRAFEKDLEKDIIGSTIFRFENYYLFGYYEKANKKYYLRKFMD